MKTVVGWVACLSLMACTNTPSQPPSRPDLDRFAIQFLDSVQSQSIAQRREVCGYIYQDSSGTLRATLPKTGNVSSCKIGLPKQGSGVIAAYHTHGAYGWQYDNEIPSLNDMDAFRGLGLPSYLSTPGGRVWVIETATQTAKQLCGLGCVTRDPGFIPYQESAIPLVANRQELAAFINR